MIVMDPAICGYCRCGYFRCGVYRPDWDRLVKRVESLAGSISMDVTRRKLILGEQDGAIGWYAKDYVESTAEGLLIPRSAAHIAVAAGSYVRLEYLFLTADPLDEGDEIKTVDGEHYEVKTVRLHMLGDSFSHRECDLTYLPLQSLTYSDLTPPVSDARSKTKTYWETYLDSAKLNNHTFIVCYADPDYPLIRVFKDKGIDIIFAVDQPNSTPKIGDDQKPYGYMEHVPTHVLTLDTQLQWLAEHELRRITEKYPEGSQWSLDRGTVDDRWLGSHRLYDRTWILNYGRGIT